MSNFKRPGPVVYDGEEWYTRTLSCDACGTAYGIGRTPEEATDRAVTGLWWRCVAHDNYGYSRVFCIPWFVRARALQRKT